MSLILFSTMRYSILLLAIVGLAAANTIRGSHNNHNNNNHHVNNNNNDNRNDNNNNEYEKRNENINNSNEYDNRNDNNNEYDNKNDYVNNNEYVNNNNNGGNNYHKHYNNNRNRNNNDNENNNDYNNNNYDNFNNNNNNDAYQADQKFLQRQQAVLQLLANVQQNNPFRNQAHQGNSFNPQQNLNRFNNQQAVKSFLKNYYNNDFLPKEEVFSSTSQQHQNQAGQLFTFLYSAQDWNTFQQAAAWARNRFNPDQFVFAFSAAVLNHPSTQGVVLPPLYEVIPHAFVPATALQQVYHANFQGQQYAHVFANYSNQNERNAYFFNNYFYSNQNKHHYNNPHNPNTVFANNDGSQSNNAGIPENPENKVSYFTEDIGVNEFHARYHAQNPPFYGSNNDYTNDENNNYNNNNNKGNNNGNYYSQRNIKRGQKFYFNHQQLYARYVLERISNDLPIPTPVNFNQGIKYGYNPNLQYANGQAVPARPPNAQFQQQQQNNNNNNNNAQQPNNNQAQAPQTYQHRLQQAAETGFVVNDDGSKTQIYGSQGVGVLANLIAFPASNPNVDYYGDYFSTGANAIGNIVDPNNQNGVAPGAVANYASAARDPAYYKFLANILQIFYNYQNNLGPYHQSQLGFSGVKIQSFDVSKLVTYFDNYKVNVDNAVNQSPYNNNNKYNNNNEYNNNNNNNNDNNNNYYNNNGNYNVEFQRLNNKPFNYKLEVQSDKNTQAIVRIFIGPKFDSNGQAFTLPQASQYFVQLDKFYVHLQNGQNVIQRNSRQSPFYIKDQPSYQQLWNRVQQAKNGQQSFYVNPFQKYYYGLPLRAQLPKGKQSGQEFIFYAIVNDVNNSNDNVNNEEEFNYNNQNNNKYNNNNDDEYNNNEYSSNEYNNNNNNNYRNYNNQDGRPIGFPFDRPIKDANYNTPNQYFKTVSIYHQNNNNNNYDNEN